MFFRIRNDIIPPKILDNVPVMDTVEKEKCCVMSSDEWDFHIIIFNCPEP